MAEPVRRELSLGVRDELLDVEEFSCLAEARVVISNWREDYKRWRPHSALGIRGPAGFAVAWSAIQLPDAALTGSIVLAAVPDTEGRRRNERVATIGRFASLRLAAAAQPATTVAHPNPPPRSPPFRLPHPFPFWRLASTNSHSW
jgi:hypothetical protein